MFRSVQQTLVGAAAKETRRNHAVRFYVCKRSLSVISKRRRPAGGGDTWRRPAGGETRDGWIFVTLQL